MNDFSPKWIIFDVGGVLLNWFESSKEFASSIGIPHVEMLKIFNEPYNGSTLDSLMHRGMISPQEAWDVALKPYGKSIDIESVIAEWCKQPYWIQETLKLMDDLTKEGYNLCILSNSWFSFNNPKRSHLFPSQLINCQYIFDSGEMGHMKPEDEMYRIVEDTLKSVPSDLYFIDDNIDNISVAKRRHWGVFHFESRGGLNGINQSVTSIRKILLPSQVDKL